MMYFGKPDYSKASNKVNRCTNNIFLIPFLTIYQYFGNYENIYFLMLGCVQLLTINILPADWSPTGPYSTAIPLFLCLLVEIISSLVKWYQIRKQDWIANHKIIKCINPDLTSIDIFNRDIYPGHIIHLQKNEISPVDGVLLDADRDDHAGISMALLTGESNVHYVPKLSKEKCLKDYPSTVLSSIDPKSIILADSIIKSNDVYLWVVSCKNHVSKIEINKKKNSRIDQFVGNYMINVSIYLLTGLVLLISLIKRVWYGNNFLVYCIQNWILFNGIIPFSIKIFLILARLIESYHNTIRVNDPLQIDDFGKIRKVICDKTGTITENKLELVKMVVSDLNVLDVNTCNLESISEPMYYCLKLCIHHVDEDFETLEDKIIKTKLDQIDKYNIKDFQYINLNGLSFTHVRKRSSKIVRIKNKCYIYTKGSLDMMQKLVVQKSKLVSSEKLITDQYPDLRLLALAYRELSENEIEDAKIEDLEDQLIFLGIIGIKDILQPNVKDTISKLITYGVDCSLCTGDRRIAALTVAKDIGMVHDLINFDDISSFKDCVDKTVIFSGEHLILDQFESCLVNCRNFIGYNMKPDHKKEISSILESNQIPCLAIGDGFNDLGMFDKSSISVAVNGNTFIENSTDYVIPKFHYLGDLFDLSFLCYQINQKLINFTFYRCSTVFFALALFCIQNRYPLDGFVLQGFNFSWMIYGIFYGIMKNHTHHFNDAQTLRYTSYFYTSFCNIVGAITGLLISFIGYHYSDYQLGLMIISILNLQLLQINQINWKSILCCILGIFNFLVYVAYTDTLVYVWQMLSNLSYYTIGSSICCILLCNLLI